MVIGVGAGLDGRDQLFGEGKFVDEAGGAVDLGELAFFFVGSRRHRDHVADASEESNFDGQRVVTGEVIQMKIEEQNIWGVFHGEMYRLFQSSCNADNMNGAFDLK